MNCQRPSRWQRRSLAALALWLVAGCSKSRADDPCPCAAEAPASARPALVDDALLAFLSKARALHREADAAEAANDSLAALRALARLEASPVPGGPRPPPEVDEVIADTDARLATLRASAGDFDAAAADVQRGLARAPNATYFRGHLFEVLGALEEQRAKALDSKGRATEAAAARARALEASERAVEVQDSVIRGSLAVPR